MAKPSATEVTNLTGTELDQTVVSALIDDAALIAADCLSGVTDDVETAALKWLSAHLVASTEEGGVRTSESLGDASESFVRAKVGDGIMGTTYGQQAVALLPCLGRLGCPSAKVTVV